MSINFALRVPSIIIPFTLIKDILNKKYLFFIFEIPTTIPKHENNSNLTVFNKLTCYFKDSVVRWPNKQSLANLVNSPMTNCSSLKLQTMQLYQSIAAPSGYFIKQIIHKGIASIACNFSGHRQNNGTRIGQPSLI